MTMDFIILIILGLIAIALGGLFGWLFVNNSSGKWKYW